MAKELFAKRKAKFVESISKTSSISSSSTLQAPTFVLAERADLQESSSPTSNSSNTDTNSEIILPIQQEKEYGIQLIDEHSREELRSTRSYQDDNHDLVLHTTKGDKKKGSSEISFSLSSSSKAADFLVDQEF